MRKFTPVTFPPGWLSVLTSPSSTGSAPITNTMGMVAVAALAATAAGGASATMDSSLVCNQFAGHGRQSIIMALCPVVLDRYISPLDEAGFVQAVSESGDLIAQWFRRGCRKNTYHRCPLLCACPKRPRRRAADQPDELAPSDHSITSSATLSSDGGTLMSSVRAVSALMTSSNLDACTTGKSAGFAPLRMRPI
jgi:hypothetical protein